VHFPPVISDGVPQGDGKVSQQDGANEGFGHKYGVLEDTEIEHEGPCAKFHSPLAIRSGVRNGLVDGSVASVANSIRHPPNIWIVNMVEPRVSPMSERLRSSDLCDEEEE